LFLNYTLSLFIKGFSKHVEPDPIYCNGEMVSAPKASENK
jgi:hypothetical protein